MENSKNVIIAVLLMLAVWFYFNLQQQKSLPPGDEAAIAGNQPQVTAPATPPTAVPAVPAAQVATAAPETRIQIETPLFRVTFNSIGGRLSSLQLRKYRETAAKGAPPVQLVSASRPALATLGLQGRSGFALDAETPYILVRKPEQTVLAVGESAQVVFRSTSGGVQVDRVYTITADSYVIGVETLVSNPGPTVKGGELEISLLQSWDPTIESDMVVFNGAASLVDGKLEEVSVDDLKKESPAYGPSTLWTSFQTKYFMSALIPEKTAVDKVRILRDADLIRNQVATPFFELAPGATRTFSYQAYFGPRDEDILEQIGNQLDEAISYGIFTPIAVPLLKTLRFFYGYLGNYGVAIILLTVIIKLIFWPLTHKSYASMKSMQKLQPEMAKIKERFKNDRQRQGQEMMELYKKHRVNPMGGCLPMLVQIPVFFALYRVLYQAIELRHAPFVFWITDLADKDPYYITPLIMGVTMFIQQKLTPSTADPMQQKIFLIMPVVFTALFLNFPAGLVVYWLVNNLLTIVQQVYIHRTMS